MNKQQYQEYLRSDHWKQLRAKKVGNKRRCGICGETHGIQVHHMFYRNIYDVQTSDLRRLCDRCHGTFHRLVKEGKLRITSQEHNGAWCQTKMGVLKEFKRQGLTRFSGMKGFATKADLAKLGVPWPPPKGWKKNMINPPSMLLTN